MKCVGLQTSEGYTDIRIDHISAVRHRSVMCSLLVCGVWIDVFDIAENVKRAIEIAECAPPPITKERIRAALDKALEASGTIHGLPQVVLEEIEKDLGL